MAFLRFRNLTTWKKESREDAAEGREAIQESAEGLGTGEAGGPGGDIMGAPSFILLPGW